MKQWLSISLLFFFLLGQVNLVWANHYCGDDLKSSEITFNPEKGHCCGGEDASPMDCCESEVTQPDSDDFFGKSDVKFDISPEFVLAYVVSLIPIEDEAINNDWPESPQLLESKPDYQALFQSYLI